MLTLKNMLFKEEWTGSTKQHLPIYWSLVIETPIESNDSVRFVCVNNTLHSLFLGWPCFSQRLDDIDFFPFFHNKLTQRDIARAFGISSYYIEKDTGLIRESKGFYTVKKCVDTLMRIVCRAGCGKFKDNVFYPFFMDPKYDHEAIYLRKIFEYFKKGAITYDEFTQTDYFKKTISALDEYNNPNRKYDPLAEKFIYKEKFLPVKDPVQLTDELLEQYLGPRETYNQQ